MKDIFMQYLKELGVRYTKEYINHIYELNPDKNNLYLDYAFFIKSLITSINSNLLFKSISLK